MDVVFDREVLTAGVNLGPFGIGVNRFEADAEFTDVVEIFGLGAALD